MTARRTILWSALLAILVEMVTLLFRFGFGLQATRDTASSVGMLTGGVRIHHGYFGVVLILVAATLWRGKGHAARWMLVLGIALLASDLIHHFAVLWPLTGTPEFNLTYLRH
jgi:hypothetical protein